MLKNKIFEKLKVMLSLEDEEVKPEETKMMATTQLVDGTEVYSETTIEAGATLYVMVDDAASMAPEGVHQTADGKIITVGPEGEIISVEDIAAEEPVVEETMKVDQMSEDEIVGAIAELIKPLVTELKDMREKFATMETKLSRVADEPAAPRVKTKFTSEATNQSEVDRRIEVLKKIKRSK